MALFKGVIVGAWTVRVRTQAELSRERTRIRFTSHLDLEPGAAARWHGG